jgi:hypothetical protein
MDETPKETTYEETLLGSGYIAGWSGMHAHGSRVIRDTVTGDVLDVLPPDQTETAVTEDAQIKAAADDLTKARAEEDARLAADAEALASARSAAALPPTLLTPVAEEAPVETITQPESEAAQ